MAKLLMKKEEIFLLKKSEAAKKHEIYGNIYPVLQTYETLSEDDLKNNSYFDDKARSVIIKNKKLLFDEIKEEWFGANYHIDATAEIHCQLCGRKNKQIYYIHNRINDAEINVGSDCIKKFSSIENISQIKRDANAQKKLEDEVKRKIQFDEIDLSNINYIKDSEEWFANFKILLPYELYNNIKTILFNLNSLRTSFIKNGGKFEYIKEQYYTFKKMLESYKISADEIYQKNKLNPLVCKKDLSDWLNKHHEDIWEKVQKNNGILNQETLKYCYQSDFMRAHLKIFNARSSDKDIKILDINGPQIRFKIENNDYIYPLYFHVDCQTFIKTIGCYCLTDKLYRYHKNALSNINIEATNNNFDSICNRLASPLQNIGLRIEKSSYTNEIYYVRLPHSKQASKWSSRIETINLGYKKVSEQVIFSKFNDIIFLSDDEIESTFRKILNKLNNQTHWMSKEEKDRMEDISKSLSIQKQKEFVPYV